MSVTQSVVAAERLKIDYSTAINAVCTANYSIVFEMRLYRDGTLIQTRTYNRTGSNAGTQRFPLSDTYVDTAPTTTGASTYQVRTIVTTGTNVTSATTGTSNDINIITFKS
jgi:hypothetical protein